MFYQAIQYLVNTLGVFLREDIFYGSNTVEVFILNFLLILGHLDSILMC